MRELGYRTVDMLVEHVLDASAPPLRRATPAEMRARLSGPPPSGPVPFDELLRRLTDDVLPFMSRGDHPRFFAFVPLAGTWTAALGDFIAGACNVYAGSWMESAGPTKLELEVLEWFREWVGLPPSFVSASGGATNTGVMDPLPELAEVCRAYQLWFHVDAAYGGFAVLTDRGRSALAGIELADSLTLDPHKWLYQPYECGCLLVRDAALLRRAFEMTPDYLLDARPVDAEVNFADLGIQLTRTSRALKVWLSVCAFGLDAFRATIDGCLDLTEQARRRIDESPSLELAAPPSLSVLCFRRRFDCDEDEEDRRNAGLVAALDRSGLGLVSSTRVERRYVLRMCILGHATGWDDVEQVLSFLEQAEVEPAAAAEPYERHPDVGRSWLAGTDSGIADLSRLPIFQSLGPDELARVANAAEVETAEAGETIVAQWDRSKDFYVVLAGAVQILLEGRHVRGLGPGEFFGELAALDWGGGFGYPRLATVVASSSARLLRVPAELLNELVRTNGGVEQAIQHAARERLRAGTS